MIKLTCSIFISSNNFLNIYFYIYEISNNSSAKYYQNKKERLQKKACERYQFFSNDEKDDIMIANDI